MALDRRTFLRRTTSGAMALAIPGGWSQRANAPTSGASIQLIRNATCIIRYAGKSFLLDPMLSDAGAIAAAQGGAGRRANPTVPLPMAAAQVVASADATLLTHTHFDHWDRPARELLPKERTLFGQPADRHRLTDFTDVRPIETSVTWEGITISRTGGQHGRGETGQSMGPVAGWVLSRQGLPTIYVAGDTVWCSDVADAIRRHNPDFIVVNSGAAQPVANAGTIIMDVEDVVSTCQAAPRATIVAVHMDALDFCTLSRDGLRAGVARASVKSTILIPQDGEDLKLA